MRTCGLPTHDLATPALCVKVSTQNASYGEMKCPDSAVVCQYSPAKFCLCTHLKLSYTFILSHLCQPSSKAERLTRNRGKLWVTNTHKVFFPGMYQEWFESQEASKIRTKDFHNVCSTIPSLTWPEYGESSRGGITLL